MRTKYVLIFVNLYSLIILLTSFTAGILFGSTMSKKNDVEIYGTIDLIIALMTTLNLNWFIYKVLLNNIPLPQ